MRADALAAYVEGGFVDLPDGRVRLACSAETEARTFEASGGMPTEEASTIGVPRHRGGRNGGHHGVQTPESSPPPSPRRYRRGRFLSFENLSHFGPLEAPGVVAAAAVRELLDGE